MSCYALCKFRNYLSLSQPYHELCQTDSCSLRPMSPHSTVHCLSREAVSDTDQIHVSGFAVHNQVDCAAECLFSFESTSYLSQQWSSTWHDDLSSGVSILHAQSNSVRDEWLVRVKHSYTRHLHITLSLLSLFFVFPKVSNDDVNPR